MQSMAKGFKQISIRESTFNDLYELAGNLGVDIEGRGYSKWVNAKLENLIKKEIWLVKYSPHLKVQGVEDNKIVILDTHIDKIVRVEYKDNRVWCNTCEKPDCMHVYFGMATLEIGSLEDVEKHKNS